MSISRKTHSNHKAILQIPHRRKRSYFRNFQNIQFNKLFNRIHKTNHRYHSIPNSINSTFQANAVQFFSTGETSIPRDKDHHRTRTNEKYANSLQSKKHRTSWLRLYNKTHRRVYRWHINEPQPLGNPLVVNDVPVSCEASFNDAQNNYANWVCACMQILRFFMSACRILWRSCVVCMMMFVWIC